MADSNITGISIRGVRKLIDEKNFGESLFDSVDMLISAVIIVSPLAAGPAALPLLVLIEPKNKLVEIVKTTIKKITVPKAGDYLDRAARMSAANCLITFTAYFDAIGQRLPELMKEVKLSDEEKTLIVTKATNASVADTLPSSIASEKDRSNSFDATDLANLVVSVPHPAALAEAEMDARVELYREMSKSFLQVLSGLKFWERIGGTKRSKIKKVVDDEIPALACSMYWAQYLGMATDFPQFFVWTVLQDQLKQSDLINKLNTDLTSQLSLVASAMSSVDLGLQRLSRAIEHMPTAAATRTSPQNLELAAAAESLHLYYKDEIERSIIEDRYAIEEDKPKLIYPKKVDAFVPQAYKLSRYDDVKLHLERESEWRKCPSHDDLGPFIMRHLESPYSVETPLLVLGHPGSGKSLLTEIIAARLAYPSYTTVRVELRDINPDLDIQAQIESQIRKDTGREINWADFAESLTMNPPIVILDGYDELLQATGKLFADYLDQVRRFQHREIVQRRPVRVIVTSRITLIDKAVVPLRTTILRLEEFNQERREAWTTVWNSHNASYFQQTGTRPFELPTNSKILQLAEHPLLLLMLALYDSNGNQLSQQPNIDQTLLYNALLTRFIERERSKGDAGTTFVTLSEMARRKEISREMDRLGVAAIGMFNRQAVHIRRDELNADLLYFDAQEDLTSDGTRKLSQADLLLGSFFFIHESRSRVAEDSSDAVTGPAAFEFLHNTFGEFLAADFILRRVIEETKTICMLSSEAALGDTLQQRLTILRESWFACLIHTPLHTRPLILSMLKEWSGHRLGDEQRSRSDLLKSLDMIIVAQLRRLLTGSTLQDLSPKGRDLPYRPLPKLGHLAIYSLNLVLLGSVLADTVFTLNENDLGTQLSGCRAWDRLVNIWRSWFPSESLAALASLFTASRQAELIMITPAQSTMAVPNISSLHSAYNIGIALADNLTAGATGIHVTSLSGMSQTSFQQLSDMIQPEFPSLLPIMQSMLPRLFDVKLGEESHEVLRSRDPGVPGYALATVEAVDRLMITPRQRAGATAFASSVDDLLNLTRYQAELAVHVRTELEPRWLPYLLISGSARKKSTQGSKDAEIVETWRQFLLTPAAAPVLRAAIKRLDREQCTSALSLIAPALPKKKFDVYDVDTAAAVAVLSWRAGYQELCVRSLQAILNEAGRNEWHLLDIPVETWDGLASLFTSSDPDISSTHIHFVAALDAAISVFVRRGTTASDLDTDRLGSVEFWIHALRIGVEENRDVVLENIIQILDMNSGELRSSTSRRWVLLLIAWARNRDDSKLIETMFGHDNKSPRSRLHLVSHLGIKASNLEEVDVNDIEMNFTHDEATDLRWVIDVLRQAER